MIRYTFYWRPSRKEVEKCYTERMFLLKYLKILLDTDLKVISLNHQNNVGNSKIMNNAAKNFDVLASLNVISSI